MGCSASVDVKKPENVKYQPETNKLETEKIIHDVKDLEVIYKQDSEKINQVKSFAVPEHENVNVDITNTAEQTNKINQDNGSNLPNLNNKHKDKQEKAPRGNLVKDENIDTLQPQGEEQIALDKALRELRQSLFTSGIVPTHDQTDFTLHSTIVGNSTITIDAGCFKAAVVDAGTGFCKAGLTGDDIPSVVIPTLVGRLRDNATSVETFIGKDAKLRGNSLEYSNPINRGIVENWDDMERVYDHILHMDLNLEPNEYGVVIPESPLSDRKRREKLTEMMFEKFDVKKLYLGSSSSLALHAFGHSTGLLVSLGHGVCHAVPVVQGNIIEHAVRTTKIGNKDVIDKLQRIMTTKLSSIDEDIARAMV
uniref:actin-like n=1 Tax=Styela clava TaxID=7725 RepID=UPI00193A0AAB|nr:actin-like [Styela clava]